MALTLPSRATPRLTTLRAPHSFRRLAHTKKRLCGKPAMSMRTVKVVVVSSGRGRSSGSVEVVVIWWPFCNIMVVEGGKSVG
eukprot:9538054-Karenia_brevis.AAC.1